MKRHISMIFAVLMILSILLTGCGSGISDQLGAKNNVVVISTFLSYDYGADHIEESFGHGSGFFVGKAGKDPQYLVTNYHVVEDFILYGAGEVNALLATYGAALNASLRVYFDSSDYVEAQVIASSESADVAILRLSSPTDKRKPLVIKEPTDKDISTQVYAIGFPGLAENAIINSNSRWSTNDATITAGVISNLVTSGGSGIRRVQLDVNISGGNSGGPLVNKKGQVLGINTMSVSSGNDSVNYAIDIREAMDLLDRNNIPYAKAGGLSIPSYAIWIAVGVLVVAVIVVVIVLIVRKPSSIGGNPAPLPPTPSNPNDTGLRVQGIAGVHQGRRYAVMAGKTMIFGRSAGSVIAYPEGTGGISGSHCSLWYENGRLYIKDNGSSYGTFVGQNKLVANQAVQLNVGDTFSLGSPKEQFRIEGRSQS